jgi:hypothetical protein
MSDSQNLLYTAVQAVHNFGAVAVVSGALGGMILKDAAARKNLAWLALAGWGTQAVSGASFGAVTYYFSHKFPDIGDIATTALFLKMACVAAGFALLAAYLFSGANWPEGRRDVVWLASSVLAFTALSAAAVLRWFS